MPILIALLALIVVIANSYAGWVGLPVWQSIAAFALVHTIFRLGKRLIKNSSETHDETDTTIQSTSDDTTLTKPEDSANDVDVSIFVSMVGIYVVMLLVSAFWYGLGYGLEKLFS